MNQRIVAISSKTVDTLVAVAVSLVAVISLYLALSLLAASSTRKVDPSKATPNANGCSYPQVPTGVLKPLVARRVPFRYEANT